MASKTGDTPLSQPAISKWLVALPYVVLVAGLLITGYIWSSAKHSAHEQLDDAFNYEVVNIQDEIRHNLSTYHQVLLGAQGLLSVAPSVQRADFAKYVAMHRLGETYPGIQGVGFSQVVPRAQINQHIQMMRKQGFPNYAIRPAGIRDPYSSIIYLEPFSKRNLRAFGFDMFSEPTRRQAMQRACDMDDAVLSAKVKLVQETKEHPQSGFLLYLPVYRKLADISSVQARRNALVGWVYEPFRMEDFISGLQIGFSRELRVRIYDGKSTNRNELMFDSSSNTTQLGHYTNISTVTFFNQPWTIEVNSLPPYEQRESRGEILLSLLLGLTFTLTLAYRLQTLVNAKRTLTYEIAQRTKELESEKAALHKSEEQLSLAIEGSGVGLWDWYIKTGEIFVNERWAALIGYSLDELQPMSINTWLQFTHPDDLKRSDEALVEYFAGHTPLYSCEVRMRHKDGRWIWLLDTGSVSTFADDGTPVRMTGTHLDINDNRNQRSLLEKQDAMLVGTSSAFKEILTGKDFKTSVDDALAILGNCLEVEHVYVFQNQTANTGELFSSMKYEWCSNPSAALINSSTLQDVPYSMFPRWLSEFNLNRPVHGPVWTLPEQERPILEAHSIQSLVVMPIFVDEALWGFIGFNDRHSERVWTVAEISMLALAASGLGGAIRQNELTLSLAESRQWLRTAVKHTATGTIIVDRETRLISDANPAFLDAVNMTEEQVVGSPCGQFLSPLDRSNCQCVAANQACRHDEFELIKSDGTRLPVIISAARMVSGGRTYIIESIVDISLQKSAEEKLRQSTALYHGMFNSVQDLIYFKDLDGHYIEYNDAFDRFFGATQKQPRDNVGLTLFDIMPEEEAQDIAERDRRVYATMSSIFAEHSLLASDGTRTTFDHHKSPLVDADGTCIGLVGVARDITERKQTEVDLSETARSLQEAYRKLNELEQTRDSLVQFTVQDMRSSLTSILSGIDIAKDDGSSELLRNRFLNMADASSHELEYMLSSLQDVYKMEEKQMLLEASSEDLLYIANLASETVNMIAIQQKVEVSVRGEELYVAMDAELIRRVIVNLMLNAVKFSGINDDIQVEVLQVDDRARVTVTDHSPGIPVQYREAVFDRTLQLKLREKGLKYSAGLSLCFCRLAVELHGGSIGVDSELGKGSTFWFELPIQRP